MVTVILTSYNRDTLLEAAITSVLTQTYQKFQLIIVDDDSDNPKTHAVLDKYQDVRQVWVRRFKLNGVPRFSRTGYAQHINSALSESRGDYITYLTCDDIFYPDRLERMVAHLDSHPDHKIVYGVQHMVDLHPDGKTTSRGMRNYGLVVPAAGCLIDHNSVMHRRECYEVCLRDGPLWPTTPDVIGMADAVVWEKFRAHGWPFHRLEDPKPTDEHRFHKGSIQGSV